MLKLTCFISTLILAASLPYSALSAAETCAPLAKTQFKAKFSNKGDQPLEIRVGARAGDADPVAQIWSVAAAPTCVAVCSTRYFDQFSSHLPIALALDCTASQFELASTPATILWPENAGKPMVRFGSWVTGYRDAPLSIELDRFTSNARVKAALGEISKLARK